MYLKNVIKNSEFELCKQPIKTLSKKNLFSKA